MIEPPTVISSNASVYLKDKSLEKNFKVCKLQDHDLEFLWSEAIKQIINLCFIALQSLTLQVIKLYAKYLFTLWFSAKKYLRRF